MNEDARRALWRADLLEFGAAGLVSFGDQANADIKLAEAELHRQFADVAARHAVAKAALEGRKDKQRKALVKAGLTEALARLVGLDMEDLDNQAAKSAVDLVGAELAALRRYWREVGEANGTRGRVAVVNHFAEPSDTELIEQGY